VSGSWDRTLKVWDISTGLNAGLESGEELATLQGHTESVWAVAVTPDGRWAVSGSDDHTLKVWDLESGEELATLPGHTYGVWAVAVTPDGRRAVSGSAGMLKVWDLKSSEIIADFSAEGALRACAVAPDGETFVAAGDSGRVHFLHLEGIE
jgi:WD40 repeat protein